LRQAGSEGCPKTCIMRIQNLRAAVANGSSAMIHGKRRRLLKG
jgi:hypothetical protein